MTFFRQGLFAIVASAFFAAGSAYAGGITFSAKLGGHEAPTNTGSNATGTASIIVDAEQQTVSAMMKVVGIRFADFAAHIVHAPVGPIHLHRYAANGEVSLLVPFPMNAAYAETPDGFTLVVLHYPYAQGAKVLNSNVPFDGFVAAMKSGSVVLNVHTNAFRDGEISGVVKPTE